ncbi:MAG: ABC transporter substrate-binding protein [Saccharofermentanales bacterium]|nr:ABC transporter substrate-binding protein [Bacillota bacterium]NLB08245.1 ABC transporter substrate-binding protein [Clostridiales bacterium]
MKFIRLLATVCVLALLLTFVAACDKKAAPETTTAAPSTEDAPAETTADIPETTAEATTEATGEADATDSAEGPITVTDMLDREITLTEPATRVVALTASDCEIIWALGAGDLLVGRGEYCDYPAEVLDIPSVQSGAETNIEQIIALEPQIIFMNKMAQSEETVAQLEEAGVKVVICDAANIEEVYTSIALIGSVMDKNDEANAVIEGMKADFAEVAELATGDGTETVYFEVSPLEYGLWTAGNGTFMNEIANLIGLKNCFEDVEGWGEISEEQVLERNPDYIVTISMYFGEGPTPVEEILSRKGWGDVTAVKNEAILNLQNNELSRPGPRLADGAKLLYEFVYVTMARK